MAPLFITYYVYVPIISIIKQPNLLLINSVKNLKKN